MPSLRLIYDVPGWAYHNNARGLERHAPPDFEVTSAPFWSANENLDWDAILGDSPVDLVFLFDFSRAALVRAELVRRRWDTALIVAWSVGWPQLRPLLYQAGCLADAMIISSREYWEHSGSLPASYTIPYGVDGTIFNVQRPIAARQPKVLWVGSQLARRLKGYDDYIVPLRKELKARRIESECLLVDSFEAGKRSPAQMASWYNSGSVIVCASEAEGTPNPPLEAAACGCTIVSTRVGNMPELIRHGRNGYLVDRNLDALLGAVLEAIADYPRLAMQMQRDIVPWLWRNRAPEFYAAFRKVLGGVESEPAPRPRRLPDRSQQVTVYVTSDGGPKVYQCLERLCCQDSKFSLEILEGVTPLSSALQWILDTCKTPYFVHIDQDVLLYPRAIGTLLEHLESQDAGAVTCVGKLYDTGLGRAIEGVEICRHALAIRYPWSETPCAAERNARISAGGHRVCAVTSEAFAPGSSPVLGLRVTA